MSILNTAIEIDDTASVAFMGSVPGVTISSHCGIALLTSGHPAAERILGRALDELQKSHCFRAILGDLARARAVVAFLEPYEQLATAEIARGAA